METFRNDFEVDTEAERVPQEDHRNVDINGIVYRMGDEMAGLTHAIMLLVDAVDRRRR